MIKRFQHKGLERFFVDGDTRGVNSQFSKRLGRLLVTLNRSKGPADMNLPGYKLHPLKGDMAGLWAINLSGNWRLVFGYDGENATDVDLVDYH